MVDYLLLFRGLSGGSINFSKDTQPSSSLLQLLFQEEPEVFSFQSRRIQYYLSSMFLVCCRPSPRLDMPGMPHQKHICVVFSPDVQTDNKVALLNVEVKRLFSKFLSFMLFP